VSMSYNSSLSPGTSTSVGIQGTWTNSNAAPTQFTINNAACG
jgi:hypothetical protein